MLSGLVVQNLGTSWAQVRGFINKVVFASFYLCEKSVIFLTLSPSYANLSPQPLPLTSPLSGGKLYPLSTRLTKTTTVSLKRSY